MWKHITLERNEKELQAQELPKTWKHETWNRNERGIWMWDFLEHENIINIKHWFQTHWLSSWLGNGMYYVWMNIMLQWIIIGIPIGFRSWWS